MVCSPRRLGGWLEDGPRDIHGHQRSTAVHPNSPHDQPGQRDQRRLTAQSLDGMQGVNCPAVSAAPDRGRDAEHRCKDGIAGSIPARAPPKQQVKLGTMSGLSHRQRCALGHRASSVPDERSAALYQPVQLPGAGGVPAGHDGLVTLKCDGDRATGLTRQASRDDSLEAFTGQYLPAGSYLLLLLLKRPVEQLADLGAALVVASSSTRLRVKLMHSPVSCDLDGSVDTCVHCMLVPPLPASGLRNVQP